MSKESQEARCGNELGADYFFLVVFEDDLFNPDNTKFRLVCSTERLLQLFKKRNVVILCVQEAVWLQFNLSVLLSARIRERRPAFCLQENRALVWWHKVCGGPGLR